MRIAHLGGVATGSEAAKPIPAGYALIGQRVEVTRGSKIAGASLRFQCPGHKTLRTFLPTGNGGFQADLAYVNHRATYIRSWPSFAGGAQQSSGVIYAVCR